MLIFRTGAPLATLTLGALILFLVDGPQGRSQDLAETSRVVFTRDVQPILAASCVPCHGARAQSGGLRLDAKRAALAGGLSGSTIRAGKPAESLLYQRIMGQGDQPRMPMGGKPLSAGQLSTIKRWIEQGAEWPEGAGATAVSAKKHWAFVPPQRPALPAVSNAAWVRSPIDTFVLARLDKEALSPSPEAAKTTLLRRLSLDLIGLPPTVEETAAFLADRTPRAYEKQVDRLLASPHYGERWARIWLDAARYADSDGYEKDMPRQAWAWRDWVINALNRDLPYNQFVTEQIAGDLLPHATQDQVVATGFLRNSMLNEEGGADPEQFRMESMFDRMEAVGKGVLGVTIQCAQCHNHKFDPLKQEEYYRMFAFLNDSHEARMPVYTAAEQMRRVSIVQRSREREEDLQHRYPDWKARMAAWESARKETAWVVLQPKVEEISTGGEKLVAKPDGSLLALGYAAPSQKLKLTAKTDLTHITAFRLELLTDGDLPFGGPGRSPTGVCALSEFSVSAAPSSDPQKPRSIKLTGATADFGMPPGALDPRYDDMDKKRTTPRTVGPVEFAIDGHEETAWGIDAGPGLRNQSRNAVFTPEKPLDSTGETELTFTLAQMHSAGSNTIWNQNLGRFRLSVSGEPDALADPVPAAVRQVLSIPASQRTASQTLTVFHYWRTTVPEWKSVNQEITGLWKDYPEGVSQMVLQAMENPRETHLLKRGSFLTPGEQVHPGVPAFLNPLPAGAKADRLTFARWLVARDSPTTARSIVNRVWQAYFGTGLVSTAENFGTQSDPPSHPELLDWLAVEFMDRGWSLKQLQRTLVLSATYRQVSRATPELLARDPQNRLLARGARFRVDAEVVRDIALAASGLLNAKVGGPSVYPPAPAFLFLPPVSYSKKQWPESAGADRYRRALYTFRFRSVPYPMLQAFDAPNGDTSCVRRDRSNTPLQALTTLNEPLFLEAARALAGQTLQHGGATDSDRLTYAFKRCLSRAPAAAEMQVLLKMLQAQTERFTADRTSSSELLAAAQGTVPTAQGAAWIAISRVLLNLDETITRE